MNISDGFVLLQVSGIEKLSEAQRFGLLLMIQGAVNVIVAHSDDPERGDTGWRIQSLEDHLDHAKEHADDAWWACEGDRDSLEKGVSRLDDDGLPHIDHASARIALYYAKKSLLARSGGVSNASGG